MHKGRWGSLAAGALLVALAWSAPVVAAPAQKAECFGCHTELAGLHRGSKHAALACDSCHAALEHHLVDSGNKPRTSLEAATCGSCHQDQYASFRRVDSATGLRKEGEGPRAHPFMVVDLFTSDRFAAGRYRLKDGADAAKPGKAWEVLVDTGKPLPGEGAAGSPVCLQCKTSDLTLTWKHRGDKDVRAKWDRTSDLAALVQEVQNPAGCIGCHDPHSSRPRIVGPAVVDDIERHGADTVGGAVEVVSFRDGFRKIALLDRPDSSLLCGQCHAAYNYNDDGATAAERRASRLPLQSAAEIIARYERPGPRDSRHAVTGASLVELQHPAMETFRGGIHDAAGVTCADCHMPQEKNKAGKTFTGHQAVRPQERVGQSCLGCHPQSNAEEKLRQIQTVQNATRDKLREAEAAIGKLIDSYARAREQGVAEATLAQARKQHEIAHALRQWWSAEKSGGWHNPQLARETLAVAVAEAAKGVELLTLAMNPPPVPAAVK